MNESEEITPEVLTNLNEKVIILKTGNDILTMDKDEARALAEQLRVAAIAIDRQGISS